MEQGLVFNIQRFSIHDGPGIRTTVFLKGCNLHCAWCHNPESISRRPQLEFNPSNCIGCGRCFEVCPAGAHIAAPEGHLIDRERCTGCFRCVDTCYAKALTAVGRSVSVQELVDSVETDVDYYRQSGGGVTFSGGECLLQSDFLLRVFKELKQRGIHIAVDTAGCLPYSTFEQVAPYVDLYLFDLKAFDPEVHRRLTGVRNEPIVENFQRLVAGGRRVWVRIPFIPGMNDREMPGIASLVKGLPVDRIELLPFHRLGEAKYKSLGIEDYDLSAHIPSDQEIENALNIFRDQGISIYKS